LIRPPPVAGSKTSKERFIIGLWWGLEGLRDDVVDGMPEIE